PDRAAIPDALPQAERFRERAHVRGRPEMSFGPVRLQRRRAPAGRDTALVDLPPLLLGCVASKPVVRTGELPRGVEILRIGVRPDRRRAPGAGEGGAIRVERVRAGVCSLAAAVRIKCAGIEIE